MSWQQKGKNSILQLRTFGLLTVLRRRRQLLHSSSLLLFRYPVQLFKFRPSSQQYQQQQTCHQKWQWHNNYTSTFSRQNSNLPFPNNNTTKLHNQYKNICVKTITWPITTTRSVFTYSTTGRESNQNQKTTRIMNNSIEIKKEVNNTGTGKRAASTATTTPPCKLNLADYYCNLILLPFIALLYFNVWSSQLGNDKRFYHFYL